MVRRPATPACASILAVMALATALGAPAHASDHDWNVASDIGQASLAALALGATVQERDWSGGKQLALSLAVTEAETYGLKHAFPETRPNGRNNRSFPSGHTSISFASAGYLHQRYGWKVGVPATLAAGFVGLARVEAHEHHWYDVVAGAALGEATAFIITKPRDDGVMLTPWADSHGGGLNLNARF